MSVAMDKEAESRTSGGAQRVAVIGSGIGGLGACAQLKTSDPAVHLTLFEKDGHFGGHANTLDMTLEGLTHGVDTGFLVYNERTYPRLIALFAALGVPVAASDMSFSVQIRQRHQSVLEWSGHSLATVFAQKRNLLRPGFWRMLADILRFNRLATGLAKNGGGVEQSVQEFLDHHRFSAGFREHYLLPMIACIWSCPLDQMLAFPMATLVRFCHNHGLLQVSNRPQWYTVRGGSRQYVNRILALVDAPRLKTPVMAITRGPDGVRIQTRDGWESFDALVLACHPDQALSLLGTGATASERECLGAIRYQSNRAVLHTDASVMPQRESAWAAWNFERHAQGSHQHAPVCLHYWLNRLQPLPWRTPVMVSLNPLREIRADQIHADIDYAHPVFDAAAIAAQQRLPDLQGHARTWYCGAWCGYGFHEDGLKSGQRAAEDVLRVLGRRLAGATPTPGQ